MANLPEDTNPVVSNVLDSIASENVRVVFEALSLVFATWMDEQEHNARLDKQEEMHQFERVVDKTLRDRRITRLIYPAAKPLPHWSPARVKNTTQIMIAALRQQPLDLAVVFFGELIGAWILSCPETLIRQHLAFLGDKPLVIVNDQVLITLMRKWLSRSLAVGA